MLKWLNDNKYFVIIILAYFALRFINLTAIPIFNDEAIYLDWGWRELHKNVLFYSLNDGKQPLVMWLFGLAEGLINDPLFAGRTVSIIFGFFTLVGLYRTGKEVFNQKIGTISALLYLIVPLFSFFDRQALMESAVAASGIWTIYLFLKLLKRRSVKVALLLGIVIGIGFFTKSTILLLITSIILVYFFILKFRQDNKLFLRDGLIAIAISQVVLLALYSQPLFWQTLSMNDRYSRGLGEIIQFPFFSWLTNIWELLQISIWHLTPLVFIAAMIGVLLILRLGSKSQKTVAWIFIVQLILFIFVAKGINPRYAMPLLPLSLLFASTFTAYYKKLTKFLLIILSIVPLYFLSLQIFQPIRYFNQLQAVTQYSQKSDYVTSSTAGYAATKAVNYLQSINVDRAIVAVRLDAGNPENAIQTYFRNFPIRIPSFLEARIINNLSAYQCLTFPIPVYFVSRDFQLAGLDAYLQEEKRFYNPEQISSVGIYRFKSPCNGKVLDLSTPGAFLQPLGH